MFAQYTKSKTTYTKKQWAAAIGIITAGVLAVVFAIWFILWVELWALNQFADVGYGRRQYAAMFIFDIFFAATSTGKKSK